MRLGLETASFRISENYGCVKSHAGFAVVTADDSSWGMISCPGNIFSKFMIPRLGAKSFKSHVYRCLLLICNLHT
jgi:hypothetical protein